MFRQRFTQIVDQPSVKKGFACAFVVTVGLGFGLGFLAGDEYRSAYCHSNDCSDSSIDEAITFRAVGVSLGVLVSSVAFVILTVLGIICCRVGEAVDEHAGLLEQQVDKERFYSSTQ